MRNRTIVLRFLGVWLLIIILLKASSCAVLKPEKITLEDFGTHWQQVKDCMEVEEQIEAPKLIIEEGDSVMCNGFERKDCYGSETHAIYIPQKTNETNVRHAMVHAALQETTGDLDQDHSSVYFLKCTGVILDETDTE